MAWAMRRAWFAAVALLLAAFPARAAEPSDAERARLAPLLKAGAGAAKAKQWAACIEAFTAAAAIDGAAKTWGELGLCEEGAGRFALAHRHLLRAREGAPSEEKEREPWTRYKAALKRVKDHVAVVFVSADPPNARIILDGRPLGPTDGNDIAVEPGVHTFAARLEGYEDVTDTRPMPAGSYPHVHLPLKRKPQAAPSATPAATPAKLAPIAPVPVPARTSSSVATWFVPSWSVRGGLLALAYLSATTLAASSVTWLGFEVARADLRSGLADNACDPARGSVPVQCDALHERYVQRQTAVHVTTGAAIATGIFGVATGLAIYLDRSPLRPTIAPTASPEGGGFVVIGAW